MGAVVVGLVMAGIVVSGCGSVERDAAAEGTTIRSEALSLEVPPGWYGDADPPETPQAPRLRAATFPLPAEPADLGQQAQGELGDDDVLITVVDYGVIPAAHDVAISLPVAVDRSHLVSFEGFREPVVMRRFTLGGHRLQLWVVFGSHDPSTELYREANRVLATLAVQPRKLALGGLSVELLHGWDGFAKDIGPPHLQVPALYVANVPWPDRGQDVSVAATVEAFERLPPTGIVVAVSSSPGGHEEPVRALRRPIRLADGYFLADLYEGQPAPHVSSQIIGGRLGDREL
ncbi:MAG TPA: hypothetical protein VG144_07420, partial [Gaiellaceae bacterium]|nr:hypothetical protein [Gaiellaceae bacterium]